MALIKNIKKASRNSRIQSIAACSYNTFESNGQKYIQLNTYGTNERIHRDVVSQTMQFDEESAKELFAILKREFGF